eukprot:m.75252 g.75252  ORF g.75252 m.75252 type:complete len:173 (+) comp14570_c0_seq2:701-1219(+)
MVAEAAAKRPALGNPPGTQPSSQQSQAPPPPLSLQPSASADVNNKRKMLWSSKKDTGATYNHWEDASIADDSSGEKTEKFMKLMGMKKGGAAAAAKHSAGDHKPDAHSAKSDPQMQKQLEKEFEQGRAKLYAPGMRTAGLGFGGASGAPASSSSSSTSSSAASGSSAPDQRS